MGRPLNDDARDLLDSMVRLHDGKWFDGCGWIWNTPSGTVKLLTQLARRGCVYFAKHENTWYVHHDWWNNLLDSLYDLNTPLDGHYPEVWASRTGTSPQRDRIYYRTSLSCSCGWVPNSTGINRSKVSNESPSKGGRERAKARYQDHIHEVLAPPAADEVVSEAKPESVQCDTVPCQRNHAGQDPILTCAELDKIVAGYQKVLDAITRAASELYFNTELTGVDSHELGKINRILDEAKDQVIMNAMWRTRDSVRFG